MIQLTKEYENIDEHVPLWLDIRTLVQKEADGAGFSPIKLVNGIPAGTEVFADPLIAKVLHNLIDNAVRHGGNITTIRFFIENVDGALALICEDDGIGMLADMKEKIFEQIPGKDHGFGLFLSREILSITGITIEEKGEPGHGAKFIMTVPAEGLRISKIEKALALGILESEGQ